MSPFRESFCVEVEHDTFFAPNGNSTRSQRVVGSNPIWGSNFFLLSFYLMQKKHSTFYRKMHFCNSYLFLSFDFQGEVPLNIENKPAD